MQVVEKSLISGIGAVYIFVLKTRYGCNLSVDGIFSNQVIKYKGSYAWFLKTLKFLFFFQL